MRSPIAPLVLAVAVSSLVSAGCASSSAAKDCPCAESPAAGAAGAASSASLYDRLGGKPAIEAVVDTFLGNVAKDARINHFFAGADVPALRGHLVDQVCAAAGGPCTYKGRDMKTVHTGMRVDDAAFGALVEDLVAALKKHGVPEREQGELLAVLGPMKSDIVTR